MSSQNISFIGLGIMGTPMALNLIKGGHQLFVYARRTQATKPLVAAGAIACSTCSAAMAASDFCIVMVSDTSDVEEVLFSENGVVDGATAGNVVIVMSTISPEKTRDIAKKLAEKKIYLLDAPVSGGDQGAISGTLSIMVGGEEEIFTRALPLLQCMGGNIVYIGGAGAGQITKMCNQIVAAQTISAIAEAFEFAHANGVDRARVREALLGGFAYSRILELHGQRILENNYTPGFKAKLHLKDMKIAAASATAKNLNLLGTDLARHILEQLVAEGNGDLDSSAMAKVISATARKR